MRKCLICMILVLILAAMFTVSVSAAEVVASGSCGDNLTWTLDDAGTITISGTGAMKDYEYYYANPPWSGKDVKKVIIENGVTAVGKDAFYFTGSLISVTIPNSVTSIGEDAFNQCRALVDVTVPDSVTKIGDGAFYGCDMLNYNVYNNAKYIGNAENPYLVLVQARSTGITSCTVHADTRFICSLAFYDCTALNSVTIPDGVVSIGEEAFNGCSKLTGILVDENNLHYSSDSKGVLYDKNKTTLIHCPGGISGDYIIPASVISIGEDAFVDCSGLNYNVYNNANYIGTAANPYLVLVKAQSTEITSCTVHSDTRIIGVSAFYNCHGMDNITIPRSITCIGDSAFYGCSDLSRVDITDLAAWCGISFGGSPLDYADELYVNGELITDLVIPDGVASVADHAFQGYELNSVTIPDSVTHIGDYAFYCCFPSKVTIGTGVRSIGLCAFHFEYNIMPMDVYISDMAAWCRISFGLDGNPSSWGKLYLNGKLVTDLVIPEGVTSIGANAFYCYESLTSVTIPGSVTSISPSAFAYCHNLTRYVVSENNRNYSSDSKGVLFNKEKSTLIQCPGSFSGAYIIPDSVTSIGTSAFYYCDGLTGVIIGNNVTDIGRAAFVDCDKLTTVKVPDSVIRIGDSAFGYCDNLASVIIGDGVTVIGEYVFTGCSNLACVVMGDGITRIGDYSFDHRGGHMFFKGSEEQWRDVTVGGNYSGPGGIWHYNMGGYTTVGCGGIYCSSCQKTVVSGGEAHSYVAKVVAPTCTKKGYTAHICVACGDSYMDTEVSATGHEYEQGICKICGFAFADYNGLVEMDGVWGYYEGGVLQEDYTGLVPYGDILFYVENGILDFTYTGLTYYQNEWRYVANSVLTDGYTGLVYFNDNWFYTVNSRIDWTFTGLVPYEGNYFYVQNNLLDWSYTGLGYHDGEWYFIQNGLLRLDYTGLVYFNDTWFYIENGHLTWDYTGLVAYEGNEFYVQNNVLDWSYTGLGYHDGGWYFIQNALLQKGYYGLVYFNSTWFYIEDSELTWTTNGLHEHEGKLYYIKNSEVDWSYNGIAEYNGVSYEVKDGVVAEAVLPATVKFTDMDHSVYGTSNRKVELIYSLATVFGGDAQATAAINSILQSEYENYCSSISGMEGYLSYMEENVTYVNNETGAVSYNDGKILSLRYETDWWMGGVSNQIPYGYTFDLSTGELLSLADAFSHEEDLLSQIKGKIRLYLKDVGLYDSYTEKTIKNYALADFEYYISETGELVVCIPVGELGSTADGSMEIPCGVYINA